MIKRRETIALLGGAAAWPLPDWRGGEPLMGPLAP
jgi:hypothetical protein